MAVCEALTCVEPVVSDSDYCEDHQIEQELNVRRPAPMGTLAQLIRGAKTKGYITPVPSGSTYQAN